ncbi:hypothetical protein [Chitiniphilus eburneus]|uniref:Nuclear transport factor 2 family protein n=1 Tax=Chitiniphilus eburneus TaxID=2571148 RepID=A0A4V5MTF2_9NEIS|nr:hypothetical protein [Chitiniphilus eburneus]TJZ76258.1 hypothetical protein FAZ21_05640 [Chitiniphilus eburneus]
MSKVRQFFARYEEGANTFDPDLVCGQFTDVFMGADPNGVAAIPNDQVFRDAIPQREAFFSQIGFRAAKVLEVIETPLDPRYTMAKVLWRMTFENPPGQLRDFEFFITYFLFDAGVGPRVAFYISHDDEQQVMREAGLIPGSQGPKP